MIYTHTLNPPMSRSVKIEKGGIFSTKSPTSLLYGTPEGTFPFRYLSEKKLKQGN